MSYTCEELNIIYEKNDGHCIGCGKALAFSNYGKPGERGAWEVDHGNPKARGGTNLMRNLWPMCVECNRKKGSKKWNSDW